MKTYEEALKELGLLSYDKATIESVTAILHNIPSELIPIIIEKQESLSAKYEEKTESEDQKRKWAELRKLNNGSSTRDRVLRSVEISQLTGHYNPNDDAYNDALVQNAGDTPRDRIIPPSNKRKPSELDRPKNVYDKIAKIIKTIQSSKS